jgi:hypothetical protein
LVEHEKMHVWQWYVVLAAGELLGTLLTLLLSTSLWPLYGLAPFIHQLLYTFARQYRRRCEVKAYRMQIATGGCISNEFAVTALAEKYDLDLSVDEARSLLFN